MQDYRMMSGLLADKSVDEIKQLQNQYSEKLKEITPIFAKYENNKSTLIGNINIFEKAIRDRQEKEIEKNFVLKKEHLQLLEYLNFDDSGFLEINYKRPLGYSTVDYGIKQILNISEEEYDENEEKYLMLLKELNYAIQYLIKEKRKDLK